MKAPNSLSAQRGPGKYARHGRRPGRHPLPEWCTIQQVARSLRLPRTTGIDVIILCNLNLFPHCQRPSPAPMTWRIPSADVTAFLEAHDDWRTKDDYDEREIAKAPWEGI